MNYALFRTSAGGGCLWSHRRVTGDTRSAIEVSVVTGQAAQAVLLHQRHDESIIDKQASMPANGSCCRKHPRRHIEYLRTALQNLVEGDSIRIELLHVLRMAAQAIGHAGQWPAEELRGFKGHQLVAQKKGARR